MTCPTCGQPQPVPVDDRDPDGELLAKVQGIWDELDKPTGRHHRTRVSRWLPWRKEVA